jgi:putative thioredoxin
MSETQPAWVVHADDTDFQRVVIEASRAKPVVVDFWAPWCGPCRALTPILERAVSEHKGEVLLVKVNIDESPGLAAQFQIESIPLVIAFRHGTPKAEFAGVYPEPYVREFMQKILPTAADHLVEEAQRVEGSDAALAEKQYRKALELDRRNEAASVGLARVLIGQGKEEEALTLLEEVGETGPAAKEAQRLRSVADLQRNARKFGDEKALRERVAKEPKNGQARYELGSLLAAQSKYDEALEMLLSAAELDHKLAMGAAREKMVEVFHIIGDRSPTADAYREKLGALLY